jgi:hypothetical protein
MMTPAGICRSACSKPATLISWDQTYFGTYFLLQPCVSINRESCGEARYTLYRRESVALKSSH